VSANLAEKKRALVSGVIKSALAAAKGRGVKLGNPKLYAARGQPVTALKAEADGTDGNCRR
jgi:hypothetical protein